MTRTKKTLYIYMRCAISRIRERAQRALTSLGHEPYRPEQHYMRGPGPKHRAEGSDDNAGKPGAEKAASGNDNAKRE